MLKLMEKEIFTIFIPQNFAFLDPYVSAELTNRLLLCYIPSFLRCKYLLVSHFRRLLHFNLYQLDESIFNIRFVGG